MDASAIPAPYRRLVDDAAIFPPGDVPLPEAVAAHRRHRSSAHADLVGGFVVGDARLPELLEVLRSAEAAAAGEPLEVSVVVSGGAGDGARGPVERLPELRLVGLEIALRDEADLAHNARRVVTAADQLVASGHLEDDVPVYVEPPRLYGAEPGHTWLAALDELAAMDLRLKLRTGGLDPDAFPGSAELATCIEAALDRELAFKCTAGLHHALRHRASDTGFEHHGFLNVLLATRASLDGAGPEAVAATLEERDAAAVRAALDEAGPDALASARRWFTSFGSCSVDEPLEDLATLGLLPDA